MRFILHIGTEKTGTSSIQSVLKQDKERLLNEYSVLLPDSLRYRGEGDNQILFPAMFSSLKDKQSLQYEIGAGELDHVLFLSSVEKAFCKEITDNKKKFDRVLISSEHLSSRLRSQSDLMNLKKWIEKFGEVEKIIIYLRKQDDYLLSSFSTSVKSGRTDPFRIPKLHGALHRYDYKYFLSLWMDVFGRDVICVRVFEKKQFYQKNLISDFYSRLNVPSNEFLLNVNDAVNFKNKSLDVDAVSFLLMFNVWMDGKHFGFSEKKLLRSKLVLYLEENWSFKKKMCLGEAKSRAFLKRYESSNTWVAKEFFGRDALFLNIEKGMRDESLPSCGKISPELVFPMVLGFLEKVGEDRSLFGFANDIFRCVSFRGS